MATYKVYQIAKMNDPAVHESINRLGWTRAAKDHPYVKAHLETTTRGSKGWDRSFWQHYEHVATVEAADLEKVFVVMNRWSEDDEHQVQRHLPLHSLSVGDIILVQDGPAHMVDPVGFNEIELPEATPEVCLVALNRIQLQWLIDMVMERKRHYEDDNGVDLASELDDLVGTLTTAFETLED